MSCVYRVPYHVLPVLPVLVSTVWQTQDFVGNWREEGGVVALSSTALDKL